MDQEISDLIGRIGTDDPPSDDELHAARDQLTSDLRDAARPDDGRPDLAAVRVLRKALDRVNDEVVERQEAAEAEAAEVAKLLEGIDDPTTDDTDDVEPTADVDEPVAAPADEPTADAEPAREREPVAASFGKELASAVQRTRARRAARRTPEDEYERIRPVEVVLSGPAAGEPEPTTFEAAAGLFNRKSHLITRGKQTLVELQWSYPQSRTMTANAAVNTRAVEGLLNPRALVAAGGICDPLPADFTHPICGDRARPIRDALPRFGADRGGVRFAPAATLGDVAAGVGVWTEATDASPGTATKDPLIVTCDAEVEVKVDAVYRSMQVGNFQARFNPEFWQSRLDLLLVAHERLAEQTLFNTMASLSTAVNALAIGDTNTANVLFVNLAKASAGLRSRHRLESTRLRFVAPSWLRDAIRASIARQVGRAGDGNDALAVADSVIDGAFSRLMIDPVWSPDLDVYGAQGAGNLLNWPGGDAVGLLFPEGTFFFLDGGTLDLGIEITDSTLNTTNDRQAFAETFEQVALRGCESYAITFNVAEDCVCESVLT